MDVVLWIVQILLALAFVGSGYTHSLGFARASARPEANRASDWRLSPSHGSRYADLR